MKAYGILDIQILDMFILIAQVANLLSFTFLRLSEFLNGKNCNSWTQDQT